MNKFNEIKARLLISIIYKLLILIEFPYIVNFVHNQVTHCFNLNPPHLVPALIRWLLIHVDVPNPRHIWSTRSLGAQKLFGFQPSLCPASAAGFWIIDFLLFDNSLHFVFVIITWTIVGCSICFSFWSSKFRRLAFYKSFWKISCWCGEVEK